MESATYYSTNDRNSGYLIERGNQKDDRPLILVVEENNDDCEQIKNLLDKEFNVVITLNSGKVAHLPATVTRTRRLNSNELSNNVRDAIQSIKNAQQRIHRRSGFSPTTDTDPQRDEFLQKATAIVAKYMNDSEFNVTVLCKELSTSRMQLHRKLKCYTGQSTSEFIRSIRMRRAAKLFESGKMKVIEVMYEIGIESCSYFTKAFKNHFMCTPSQYASNCKKNHTHALSIVK